MDNPGTKRFPEIQSFRGDPAGLHVYTPGEEKGRKIGNFASTIFGGIDELHATFADGKKTYVDSNEAVDPRGCWRLFKGALPGKAGELLSQQIV